MAEPVTDASDAAPAQPVPESDVPAPDTSEEVPAAEDNLASTEPSTTQPETDADPAEDEPGAEDHTATPPPTNHFALYPDCFEDGLPDGIVPFFMTGTALCSHLPHS